jgi:putative FmdB family regulatory protein
MPIYEYRCPDCGEVYEKLVMTMGAPTPPCPSCGGTASEKIFSAPGSVGVASSSVGGPSACPQAASCASGFS